MEKKWILIGSAPNADLSILAPLIEKNIPVICADGGMRSASAAGITPRFFVGDLDSGNKPGDVDGMILPQEKDYTDMHTAVLWAIDQGAHEVYLAGCTNGRADHYFANVLLLEMLLEHGVRGVIMDAQNRIFCHVGGKLNIRRKDMPEYWDDEDNITAPESFKYVSILPMDEELCGVTLKGFKYSLDRAVIKRSCPIGVSNELVSDMGEINVEKGKCIVILSKDVK